VSGGRIDQQRSAALRRRWHEDPEWAAEMRRRMSAAKQRRMAEDPSFRAQLKARGRALGKSGVGNACRPAGSEERQVIAKKVRDKRLAWCPEGYRALYMELLMKRRLPAVDAREIVEAQMERDGCPRPIVLPTRKPLRWDHPRAAETGSAFLGAACAALVARERRA
jgi:hypothetical protein